MGHMTGEPVGASRIRGQSWGHNATRLAILAAARRIVACEGTQGVSLTRAADEAGFARATVYGHFRNKEELLVSIVADDLATLGRTMRKALWNGESIAPAQIDKLPEAVIEPEDIAPVAPDLKLVTDEFVPQQEEPVAEAVPQIELPAEEPVPDEPVAETHVEEFAPAEEEHEPLAQESEEADQEPEPQILFSEPRSTFGRAELREVQAKPELPEPAPVANAAEETPLPRIGGQPRVDAWLERRLRVFERTLTDIESRLEKAERGTERAQGLVAEGMRDMQQQFDMADRRQREFSDGIARRLETADQKTRAGIAQIRADLDSFLRGEMPIEIAKPDRQEPETGAEFTPGVVQRSDDQRAKTEPSASFISAARRAASAAAEIAEQERSISGPLMGGMKWPASEDKRKLYTRYLIAGAGILVFILFAAGMVLRHGAGSARVATPQTATHATLAKLSAHQSAPLDKLTALANSGDAQAELIVGLKYLHENGGGSDAKAAAWITRAANAREPVAQYLLGTLYERGLGVKKDAAAALHWYEQAANQGNRKAMYRLGISYAQGIGVQKDYTQSASWFEKAAEAGLVDAQFNLAVLYERGEGVPQSLLDAYKWYAIAASHGDKESQLRVDALGSQLSPDATVAAERAVQQFTPGDLDRQANVAPAVSDVAGEAE